MKKVFLDALVLVLHFLDAIVLPNWHTMSNPRRFDVDITSIRRRANFDEFPRHFRVLFRCNFDGRKIHVVSTYFFDVISMVEKSTSFPHTFFDVISLVEKSTLFPRALLDVISMVEMCTVFLFTFLM